MTVKIFKDGVPTDAAKLRQDVFVAEQGFTDEFDEFDARAIHFVMYDGEEAVATLRFYDEGQGSYHVGRVAVKSSRRGEGLGRLLMTEAKAEAKKLGATVLTVGAQEDKAGFYERCGFAKTGERYFEQGRPHVSMRAEI